MNYTYNCSNNSSKTGTGSVRWNAGVNTLERIIASDVTKSPRITGKPKLDESTSAISVFQQALMSIKVTLNLRIFATWPCTKAFVKQNCITSVLYSHRFSIVHIRITSLSFAFLYLFRLKIPGPRVSALDHPKFEFRTINSISWFYAVTIRLHTILSLRLNKELPLQTKNELW